MHTGAWLISACSLDPGSAHPWLLSMPRPLPQAVLQALPTTPGSSPGSAHPQGSSPAPAHHTWLLPRLCPSSQAPLQALPTSPGPAHCLRLRPPHQDPSPGPAHYPRLLSRPRPQPGAPCRTSGRRSHSAALLLAHVAGTGPSTAVPETRPDGLVWWPGHRALTEAEFPQTRKAQARADVVRPREARPPRGRGGRVGSVPGCLPLCVPEGGRGLDRSARGHGWHPERAGTRCRRLTTLARRGGLGRERPDVVLQPG